MPTKWVGDGKQRIQRIFVKCGISVAIDGSQDDDINIRGLENYSVGDEKIMRVKIRKWR